MAKTKTTDVFAEPDHERLLRRLRAVTAGDLSGAQVRRLAEGDLDLIADLSLNSKVAVRALVAPDSAAEGQLEKMVGTTLDYVPVSYLDLARRASNAVLRVVDEDRRAIGTGTMISPRMFLTNNHVSEDADHARHQILQFDFELNIDGTPRVPTEFRLDPDIFFWTSPQAELDSSLVAVGRRLSGDRDLAALGFCPLSAAGDKHAEGDFVTIVQHPEGDFKQIALRENRVIGRGKGGTTLHYGTDTLPGSSGSPVFNDQFELVALHHAGGAVNEKTLESGAAVPNDSNEGLRISAIVAKLRAKLDELPEPYRTLLAEVLDPPTSVPQQPIAVPEAIQRQPAAQTIMTTAPNPRLALPPEAGWVETHLAVPLHIAVQVAQAGEASSPTSEPTAALPGVIERNQAPSEEYSKRRGSTSTF